MVALFDVLVMIVVGFEVLGFAVVKDEIVSDCIIGFRGFTVGSLIGRFVVGILCGDGFFDGQVGGVGLLLIVVMVVGFGLNFNFIAGVVGVVVVRRFFVTAYFGDVAKEIGVGVVVVVDCFFFILTLLKI